MKNSKFIFALIAFISSISPTHIVAQSEDCPLEIGINLAGPVDYGSEWPLANIFKNSREWITHNHPLYSGDQPWDTQNFDQMATDDNGYPLEVPFPVMGSDTLQVVRTVWANTKELISGTYVLLYDGIGKISFWGDATVISESPGRLEVEVSAGPDRMYEIISMEIEQSSVDDHVRNIRFLLPGTEDTYEVNPWSPQWLEKLEPFNTLRFMDWGQTNNSPLSNWEDRSKVDNYTYTTLGYPYESWIDICNLKEADAWVCVPHLADDNYVRQMAMMFRDQLNPSLKIHVEYSNELWNWIFNQTHYGHDELDQSLSWPERVGPKIADVMRIWTEVFEGQEDRLSRVLGVQNGYFDIGDRIFRQIRADGDGDLIDIISPSGYMYYDVERINNLGASATGGDVISAAREHSFDPNGELLRGWRENAALAQQYGKKISFYESGEHFTPDPWGEVVSYTPALRESHTHPGLYDLYIELFDTLANLTEDKELMMHFSFISPHPDTDVNDQRYGNFGALHSQFHQSAPYTESPKYQSMLDYACTDVAIEEALSFEVEIFPNPASDYVNVTITNEFFKAKTLLIYDMLAKVVLEKNIENQYNFQINTAAFYQGLYKMQFIDETGNSYVQKLIIN